MRVVAVRALAERDILAGSQFGELLLVRLLGTLGHESTPGIICLDFGETIATASFLRAFVLGLRSYLREGRPDSRVVVANCNDATREELRDLLVERNDALAECKLVDGAATEGWVLGKLDEKQALALRAVIESGSAEAVDLARRSGDDSSERHTKWNNRLAALVRKGLLLEESIGRAKRYRAVVKGLRHGT